VILGVWAAPGVSGSSNLAILSEPTDAELAAWDAVFRSASATIRRLSEDPEFLR